MQFNHHSPKFVIYIHSDNYESPKQSFFSSNGASHPRDLSLRVFSNHANILVQASGPNKETLCNDTISAPHTDVCNQIAAIILELDQYKIYSGNTESRTRYDLVSSPVFKKRSLAPQRQ